MSGAGKTTVARSIESQLREAGISCIRLDGDDIRNMFGLQNELAREDRERLAHGYMRLATTLSNQGHVVVIAAIAQFQSVRDWIRLHCPNTLETILEVPEDQRRARCQFLGKSSYSSDRDLDSQYDRPDGHVVRFRNSNNCAPTEVASTIVDLFLGLPQESKDHGRLNHWRVYYSSELAPEFPSPFALEVARQLGQKFPSVEYLLDVGCGNGRDSIYFQSLGWQVTGIDASQAAIESARRRFPKTDVNFMRRDVTELPASPVGGWGVIYSRFVLHAITLYEEYQFFQQAREKIAPSGMLLIEARSVNDPRAARGDFISASEKSDGHYRRFMDATLVCTRLHQFGFTVTSVVESSGLARFESDDPVVARVFAVARLDGERE